MYNKNNNNDKNKQVKEIIEKLENGIKNFTNTEEYIKYLEFASKFHNYSYRNALLIQSQLPNAHYLKGFKSWSDLDRKIIKGSKAIKILAPVFYSKETEKENGEKETEEHLFFKTVNVFDVSQTTGDDNKLPILVTGLKGNTDKLDIFKTLIKSMQNIDVEYKELTGGVKGYYSPMENRIVIKKGLEEVAQCKTMVHELTHSLLHKDFDYSNARGQAETEAESVAFIVCKYFGIDTEDYSFPYINGWANDDIKVLKKSLDTIQKTACKIIEEVEKIIDEKGKEAPTSKEEVKGVKAETKAPKTTTITDKCNKLIADLNKKLSTLENRTCTFKGVKNLSCSDLETILLYANAIKNNELNTLCKPYGNIEIILNKYGVI